MRREHFRIVIGTAVVLTHAACLGIIFFLKNDWLTPSQQVDLGLLFVPISSAYLVAVVRSAVEQQSSFELSKRVNLNYCIIISLVTALSLVGLLLTVTQLTGDLEIGRHQILLFEIAFGTAFGFIAADLFGKIEIPPATDKSS